MLGKETELRVLVAHVLPMFLFLALLALTQWLNGMGESFALRHPEFWLYPLQTIACGALLLFLRRYYRFQRLRHVAFALVIGCAVFILWIAPQQFLGATSRTNGFNPTIISHSAAAYWSTVALRFVRLVVIVPFVEEIFWRGFLLRFLINEKFERVPFGEFSWLSFAVVAVAFGLSHSRPDWPAALLTGVIYNLVAYRTRSLASCVLAHGTTNLLLGIWIMQTCQWGFW